MEKMISITLSGVLFNIEEDAYDELNNYLESLKRHYHGEEGKEILVDIEFSIAEKFSEIIKGKNKVITRDNVRAVIKVMGTAEEIKDDGESEPSEKTAEEKNSKGGRERIFNTGKRLYRNPDDVVIAGVCSGIASYFGVDPVIVRIIFALSIFINGLGLLAYIILWIVMPEAQTNAQKLEMQGEPVNVKKLEETIKEKAAAAKNEGQNALHQIKEKRGVLYQIINFPFVVCRAVFQFFRKIFKMILPLLKVAFGVIFLLAGLMAIIGLTVASGVLLFNISSPYLVSDIPLAVFISSPFYYIGVLGIYFTVLVPVIFLILLGITLLRGRNSFRLLSSGILIALWIFSLAALAISAGDLAPKVVSSIREEEKAQNISRDYDYVDFSKLYLGGQIKAKIKPGDQFSIKMSGREKDLARLQFQIEDGQLQITEKHREETGKICVFCFDRDIQAEITAPDLKSLVTISRAGAEIEGFKNLGKISVGEASTVDAKILGQDLEVYIAGVSGRLNLLGSPENLNVIMEGFGRLEANELAVKNITIKQSALSRANLAGKAENLEASLSGSAALSAESLSAKKAQTKTEDNSEIKIKALENLEAIAKDNSTIYYVGSPRLEVSQSDNGRVEKMENENFSEDDDRGEAITIIYDHEAYAPFMSSIRGIGLEPSRNSEDFKYYWSVNGGKLVDSWENQINVQSLVNEGEKIYWTIGEMAKSGDSLPIVITLKVKDDGGELISSQDLRLEQKSDGVFQVIK